MGTLAKHLFILFYFFMGLDVMLFHTEDQKPGKNIYLNTQLPWLSCCQVMFYIQVYRNSFRSVRTFRISSIQKLHLYPSPAHPHNCSRFAWFSLGNKNGEYVTFNSSKACPLKQPWCSHAFYTFSYMLYITHIVLEGTALRFGPDVMQH